MSYMMHHPIDTGLPAVLQSIVELPTEILQGLIFRYIQIQGGSEVGDGFVREFGYARWQHHGKQIDE